MNSLIAMITMLIDHVGLIFFPDSPMFRIIGRIAFPLYCWFLVQGYLHTRSHKKYMLRLLGLAVLSQVPFVLALERYDLNVIFTLLLSLIGLHAAERIPDQSWRVLILIAVLAAAIYIPMDYGIYGVLLVFIYRYADGWKKITGHALLELLFLLMSGPGYWLQTFSLFATLLIVFPWPCQVRFVPKWLYRFFYPAHLAVLYGIKVIS